MTSGILMCPIQILMEHFVICSKSTGNIERWYQTLKLESTGRTIRLVLNTQGGLLESILDIITAYEQ